MAYPVSFVGLLRANANMAWNCITWSRSEITFQITYLVLYVLLIIAALMESMGFHVELFIPGITWMICLCWQVRYNLQRSEISREDTMRARGWIT